MTQITRYKLILSAILVASSSATRLSGSWYPLLTHASQVTNFFTPVKVIAGVSFLAITAWLWKSCRRKNLTKYKQELFKKYNPTAERCRPTIRASDSKDGSPRICKDSLVYSADLEGKLVCLLSGYKHVLEIETSREFEDLFDNDFEALLEKEKIHALTVPGQEEHSYIFYTPQGEASALLLLKKRQERLANVYLAGHLYGYQERDIHAFYVHAKLTTFEDDKKQALAWLEKNKNWSPVPLSTAQLQPKEKTA